MQQSSLPFTGDQKVGRSLLSKIERRAIDWIVPRLPSWIHSYHLTLATIPISLLIVLFSYLAIHHIAWLWGVSGMIALQYITDALDGSLGKYRQAGLRRWGYYMDHFLDYIFLCSILAGYSLILPDHFKYLQFFVLIVFGAFMVNAYLAFSATNKFRVAYLGIGPTEIRALFIAINTLIILFGKTYLGAWLPAVLLLAVLGLCLVVYRTQKQIWEIDMERKKLTGEG
ncbi:hypothetical protein EXS71_00725 [Candidatus Uhrbacteria bacterium]|nr:hypothetical protein [Candidatus Uhrbacteria bacterium]